MKNGIENEWAICESDSSKFSIETSNVYAYACGSVDTFSRDFKYCGIFTGI